MKLAVILCAILLIQHILSLFQIKYYKKSIDKIVSNYKGEDGFFVFSGMERGRLRPGAIAIIVVDKDYTIHECYMLKGMTVFTKFKPVLSYKGNHVGELLKDIKESAGMKKSKGTSLYQKALTKAGESALLSISKNKILLEH